MWSRPGLDLTYCTNIHAGESWSEVRASVEEFALPLKASLASDAPFGLGLRLSARAAQELRSGDALWSFRQFLEAHGLYVAVINGFPFGAFHGEPVKTAVFAPDWQDPARLTYTLDLVAILGELLPEHMEGGISTIPLSYKPWVSNEAAAWSALCTQLAELTAALVQLRRRTGRFIHLDIEPEPNGLVENIDELIAFFRGPLMSFAAPALAGRLAVSLSEAEQYLREHIQVCFDVCHIAIQFEDPVLSLQRLRAERIGVGRLQISSALRVLLTPSTTRAQLEQQLTSLADPIYLHQVVERKEEGTLRRFADLDHALAVMQEGSSAEWRIHFHVPLFTEHLGELLSTQQDNVRVLAFALEAQVTEHIEVETYTWHVLPAECKLDLRESIERELRWVSDQMQEHELCTKP